MRGQGAVNFLPPSCWYPRSVTFRYALPVLAWMVVIFVVSSFPNPPGASGPDVKSQIAHVVEYTVLGFLVVRLARAYFPLQATTLLLAASFTVAVAYGVTDEIHQAFVPHRDASGVDVGLDAVGACLGLLIWTGWQRLQRPVAPATA